MNMITKLATKLLAALSLVAIMASPVQALDAADMAFAFGAKAASAGQQVDLASARNLTPKEMHETEGAVFWAPVYAAAVVGTRAVMWAAPRIAPNTFKTFVNNKNAHTVMMNTRTGTHLCQVACGTGSGINGAHVGWGAGGRTRQGAANHIYQNSPWRINPW